MANEFGTNLLKMIAAELYFSLGMQTAREMYGKGYFALGAGEKAAVDQAVATHVGGNMGTLSPEALKAQAAQKTAGVVPPQASAPAAPSTPPAGPPKSP